MLHNTAFTDRVLSLIVSFAMLSGAVSTSLAAELTIREISHRPLNIRPADLGGVVQYGANRKTYFLHTGHGVVHRIGDDEESLVRVPLQSPPESADAELSYSDIAINTEGHMFVAATWTRKPNGGGAGVLVYDRDGHYERTIVLSPRTNIRHLAIDASGNMFVLGIDPGYFKGVTNLCLLIHKYTPDGNRVTAFSGCPIPQGDRTATGPQWEQLSFEVDRGSLWLEDGRLYHVLPASRTIRVFDPVTGLAVSEISLQPPQFEHLGITATGPGVAWRVLSRGRDGFLVVWSIPTTMGRTSLVGAHDRSGAARSGWQAPLRTGMPVASGPNGHVFVLSPQRDGTVSLLRGVIHTE